MSQQPPFDVLLFDLGGVLVDFAGFEELGRLLPGAPDRAEVRDRWIGLESVQRFERGSIPPREFARGVIRELELDLLPEDLIALFVDWVRGPYPGVETLLRRLQRSHRLACLSNSNELHTSLHRRSVESFMERCFFSNELGEVKPHHSVFDRAIRDLGVPPRRIAFFDDTPVNVEAAREAGLRAYRVDGIAELTTRLNELGLV